MKVLSTVKYLGNLRTECTHLASGSIIHTDAPVDNMGKGELFSPTDLCATMLCACASTIMGIYAQNHDLNIDGMTSEVTKRMSSDSPRRIVQVDVVFTMPDREYTEKQKKSLERAALTCPVHFSLHPDLEQNFMFKWADEGQ